MRNQSVAVTITGEERLGSDTVGVLFRFSVCVCVCVGGGGDFCY